MKDKKPDKGKCNIHGDDNSRRDFFKKMGLLGLGAVAAKGAFAFSLGSDQNSAGKTFEELASSFTRVSEGELDELQERGRQGLEGKKWVMVVDLAKCQNARECMKACQSAHHLRPEQHHINVLTMQDSEDTAPYYMPKPCQHCDNPPCVSVCPVDATFKRQDGIVLIDNLRCIGCRFCIAACPYSARSFNWFDPKHAEEDKDKVYDVELNVPQKKGTITKCLFSADRLRDGKLPYCVSSCPNQTYYFGDANEDAVTNGTTKETVRLSTLLRENGAYKLMGELGTKPSVYYLPPKDRAAVPSEDEINSKH